MGTKIAKSLSLLIWNNLEDRLSSGTGLVQNRVWGSISSHGFVMTLKRMQLFAYSVSESGQLWAAWEDGREWKD